MPPDNVYLMRVRLRALADGLTSGNYHAASALVSAGVRFLEDLDKTDRPARKEEVAPLVAFLENHDWTKY